MNRDEARAIVTRLKDAYPQTRLEEPTAVLFIDEVVILDDYDVGIAAAEQIIRHEQWFPAMSTYLAYYREIERTRRHAKPLPDEPVRTEIPQWVHVWWWARRVKGDMRPFPQYEPQPSDAMVWTDYHELEKEWLAAGEPTLSAVAELLQTVSERGR